MPVLGHHWSLGVVFVDRARGSRLGSLYYYSNSSNLLSNPGPGGRRSGRRRSRRHRRFRCPKHRNRCGVELRTHFARLRHTKPRACGLLRRGEFKVNKLKANPGSSSNLGPAAQQKRLCALPGNVEAGGGLLTFPSFTVAALRSAVMFTWQFSLPSTSQLFLGRWQASLVLLVLFSFTLLLLTFLHRLPPPPPLTTS